MGIEPTDTTSFERRTQSAVERVRKGHVLRRDGRKTPNGSDV
jgi:hypothetical protein